jgi:SLOG family YspA-like protein
MAVRVLVCGPRDMTDYWLVHEVLNGIHKATPITCIIEGGALGADRYAKRWATDRGVFYEEFSADWEKHGKAAGPMRNAQMIREGNPDRVVAFISQPPSRGTANMVQQAKKAELPVLEIVLDD